MTSPQVAKPGYYGQYGGQFVPELLMPAVTAVAEAFAFYRYEPTIKQELTDLFNNYSKRP